MSFVAFIIWVIIVAGTGYMLWKLVFEGRMGKKEEQEPMAVKTEKPAEENKPEEFKSDVVEEPPAGDEEAPEEPEVIEGEAEEVGAENAEPDKEEEEKKPKKPEKRK